MCHISFKTLKFDFLTVMLIFINRILKITYFYTFFNLSVAASLFQTSKFDRQTQVPDINTINSYELIDK